MFITCRKPTWPIGSTLRPVIFTASLAAAAFTTANCGSGSPSSAPTSPSTPQSTAGQWTINSDANSSHAATFTAADASVLDYWRGTTSAGKISDLRIRRSDGTTIYIQVDVAGRPTFVQDRAGTKLWVNAYSTGQADVTIANQSGASWRGIVPVNLLAGTSSVACCSASRSLNTRSSAYGAPVVAATTGAELLQTASVFCNIWNALGPLMAALCLIGAAAAVPATFGATVGVILTCAGAASVSDIVQQAVQTELCNLVTSAAAMANDPSHVTTGLLGETTSPIPPAPAVPITLTLGQPFIGDWTNTNPTAASITRARFEFVGGALFANMWGKCEPTDCDWSQGNRPPGKARASNVTDAFLALSWTFDFGVITQQVNLQSGLLKIVTHTHFTDGSGRLDFDYTDYLKK